MPLSQLPKLVIFLFSLYKVILLQVLFKTLLLYFRYGLISGMGQEEVWFRQSRQCTCLERLSSLASCDAVLSCFSSFFTGYHCLVSLHTLPPLPDSYMKESILMELKVLSLFTVTPQMVSSNTMDLIPSDIGESKFISSALISSSSTFYIQQLP